MVVAETASWSAHGKVIGFPQLQWHEGIGIRLEWTDERLWLLVEPRTVFEGIDDESRGAAADFHARERSDVTTASSMTS